MFINDGKSLFGNKGLICSLIIILILLYFSYTKCLNKMNYINNTNININDTNDTNNYNTIIEPFFENDNSDNEHYLPKPENVRINLEGNNIIVKFTMSKIMGIKTPSKFILVLAQYDNNKKNTGNNKFYLSNEYELDSSVNIDSTTYQTNICTLFDGEPKCSYKFSDLNISDENGNLFYYKIGISAVYKHTNTSFVMPYNVNTQDKLFTLNSSTDTQNQQYTDFLKYQENLNKKNTNILKNSSMISTADGQYELIKSQLGNYPDNLLLDEQTITQKSLSDLVDKNMSHGILNINVKMDSDDLNTI